MNKLTVEEKSWIMYDVANSAFVLILVTTIMPIFFKSIASKGVSNAVSTANWGYANSLASFIVAFSAPILGSFADYEGNKKKLFSLFLGIGLIATLLLLRINTGDWIKCMIFYIIARVGWSGTNVFYDSFLTDVTSKEKISMVSAYGYSWGYIGSVIPFIVCILAVILLKQNGNRAGISILSGKISIAIVFLWWGLFSIPILKNTKQNFYIEKKSEENIIIKSFFNIFQTLKNIKKY